VLTTLTETLARSKDRLAHVLHARGHRRKALRGVTGRVGQNARQRGLTGTGWTPEDHRRQLTGLDEAAQRTFRSDEVVLTYELIERPRPQEFGERSGLTQTLRDGVIEE